MGTDKHQCLLVDFFFVHLLFHWTSLLCCAKVMSLLGKSSLLNAGAIPLAMGGTAVSMVTDGVGSTIRGGAGLLEHLTMDEDCPLRGQTEHKKGETVDP